MNSTVRSIFNDWKVKFMGLMNSIQDPLMLLKWALYTEKKSTTTTKKEKRKKQNLNAQNGNLNQLTELKKLAQFHMLDLFMVASFNAAQIDSFNGPNHEIILFLSSFQKKTFLKLFSWVVISFVGMNMIMLPWLKY